jgi:4-carboxymuconolactone decarboxylase
MHVDISTPPLNELPDELQQLATTGALVNIFQVMLRSPQIALNVVKLGASQFSSGALSPVDRELAILTTAGQFDAAYEISQHEAISASVGVTAAQRAAVAVRQWDSPDLDAAQQALLRFLAAAASAPTVPPTVFDDARRHYSDQQIVEALVLMGYYFMLARVSTVLDIPQDPPNSDVVLQAGIALDESS